ncbi:hypothetical protein HYDPIDRAFT_169799 [Hydnomerulius pinastri MD-312]|uniref:Uncharacterized protein n=1 Tax=Hydnomerulius pinastri MD-312 TaxID=994086 RepID=A0A0C9VTF0_9AGAM|nr:hypothetical protein HYDPIDRAFT_169799 [Hydnomerulius pinastri MD-312]
MSSVDPRSDHLRIFFNNDEEISPADIARLHEHSPPCFDTNGHPVFFGSAHRDTPKGPKITPAKVTMWGNQLVCMAVHPNGGTEEYHDGPFSILPFTEDMELVPAQMGCIPGKPVLGGHDVNGLPLYHAVVFVKPIGPKLPCVTGHHFGFAKVTYSGLAYEARNFEVLCWKEQGNFINRLPVEILQNIFELLAPPSVFLDPQLHCGPRLPGVMHSGCAKRLSWYLYRQVVIRRIDQIPLLCETLQNDKLGSLVNDLYICCGIPYILGTLGVVGVQKLIQRCTRLSKLALEETLLVEGGWAETPLIQISLPRYNHITHLRVILRQHHNDELEFISYFSNLRSLAISVDHGMDIPPDWDRRAVKLLFLEELSLRWTIGQSLKDSDCQSPLIAMATSWTLPSIRSLSVIIKDRQRRDDFEDITNPIGPAEVLQSLSEFLQVFGRKLTYLSCYCWYLDEASYFQEILNFCPALQHFVMIMPYNAWLDLSDVELSHQRLQWIDIWTTYPDLCTEASRREEARANVASGVLPSLRGVRFLDDGLFESTTTPAGLAMLPVEVPPTIIEAPDELLRWKYPGLDVQHDPGALYRKDILCLREPCPDYPMDAMSEVGSAMDVDMFSDVNVGEDEDEDDPNFDDDGDSSSSSEDDNEPHELWSADLDLLADDDDPF